MKSSRCGTVQMGVAYAEANGVRQRAVCYVTRGRNELLVFEEAAAAPQGILVQLPGGGVDPGETPAQAAAREAFEETGLADLGEPVHLGSCVWGREGWTGPEQVWHYFQFSAPPTTPDAWTHTVTGGELDTGMNFHLRFTPLMHPDLTPGHGSHEYLPELTSLQESR